MIFRLAAIGVAWCCAIATASAQGRYVDAERARIYYEVDGTGDAIVLIHGWSLNLRMFDPQIEDLAREHRVVRVDRRGFGQSTGDEDTSWDADDLRRVLDALGINRAHLLGMSQGARAVMAFALAYPDRTSSLILHGSPAPEGFGLPFNGPDRLDQTVFEALAATSGIDAAKRAWAAHPLLEIPTGHPDAERRMAQQLAAYRGGRWLNPRPPSGPTKPASMNDLAAIRVPTLVIVGEREVPYLRIVADALTYGIKGAKKVVIPTGGHMVNLVEPAIYNRAVLDFLRTATR